MLNSVVHGKLLRQSCLGKKLERDTKRGRGKKSPVPTAGLFSEHTVARFRKIGDHEDDIQDYHAAQDSQSDAPAGVHLAHRAWRHTPRGGSKGETARAIYVPLQGVCRWD